MEEDTVATPRERQQLRAQSQPGGVWPFCCCPCMSFTEKRAARRVFCPCCEMQDRRCSRFVQLQRKKLYGNIETPYLQRGLLLTLGFVAAVLVALFVRAVVTVEADATTVATRSEITGNLLDVFTDGRLLAISQLRTCTDVVDALGHQHLSKQFDCRLFLSFTPLVAEAIPSICSVGPFLEPEFSQITCGCEVNVSLLQEAARNSSFPQFRFGWNTGATSLPGPCVMGSATRSGFRAYGAHESLPRTQAEMHAATPEFSSETGSTNDFMQGEVMFSQGQYVCEHLGATVSIPAPPPIEYYGKLRIDKTVDLRSKQNAWLPFLSTLSKERSTYFTTQYSRSWGRNPTRVGGPPSAMVNATCVSSVQTYEHMPDKFWLPSVHFLLKPSDINLATTTTKIFPLRDSISEFTKVAALGSSLISLVAVFFPVTAVQSRRTVTRVGRIVWYSLCCMCCVCGRGRAACACRAGGEPEGDVPLSGMPTSGARGSL